MKDDVRELIIRYIDNDPDVQMCDEVYQQIIRNQGRELSCEDVDRYGVYDQRIFTMEYPCSDGFVFVLRFKDAIPHFDGQLDNYQFDSHSIEIVENQKGLFDYIGQAFSDPIKQLDKLVKQCLQLPDSSQKNILLNQCVTILDELRIKS